MYLFGLSKEEVLSQKHVASSHKETLKQNPMSTVTLFGRQVFPVKSSAKLLMMRDIDLRLPPADHYTYCSTTVEMGFHSAFEAKEAALATNWTGKRNPKIVIDLEEPPTTEHADSISYEPSFLADGISSNIVNMESGLLDLNRTPPADAELVSEPHYSFLQDLNCPYIEETETSCEKSGTGDGPTPLCSPKSQNVDEKEGTASPASYTSCCTTENNLRRGSSPRALDHSCRTRLEFPATEVSPENECCNDEEEFSDVIQTAAESLVHLSAVSYQERTNSSSQDQDFSDKPEMGNAERCYSCDSYELHTLGISETNTEEELCVSSMALDELSNLTRDNNEEIGLKLRRGRRMKNFQKEIFPSLTSLSRHEIREDINILEAVLRSREYKEMQKETKDVNLGANQRNKRSVSQRYVGKRRRKHE